MNITGLACFTNVCGFLEKMNIADRKLSYLFCFSVYCFTNVCGFLENLTYCYSIFIHCNIIPNFLHFIAISFLLILTLISRILRWQCLDWYPASLVHGKILIVQLDLTGPPSGNFLIAPLSRVRILSALTCIPCMACTFSSSLPHQLCLYRCFSSSGEASSVDDYLWLMGRACYKPVIEYCGGTEIGGGFVTGSLLQPQALSAFSTPAMGCNLFILDSSGNPLVSISWNRIFHVILYTQRACVPR